jgi:hypothetical protein
MLWNIEPMLTKNVVKFTTYTKGPHSLTHATYYRWGEAIVESDIKPVFEDYNEEVGINVTTFECQLHDCYYSCITNLSIGIPKHIKTHLRNKLFVEDYEIRELEDDGWCYCNDEIIFRGTLKIEKKMRDRCRD